MDVYVIKHSDKQRILNEFDGTVTIAYANDKLHLLDVLVASRGELYLIGRASRVNLESLVASQFNEIINVIEGYYAEN